MILSVWLFRKVTVTTSVASQYVWQETATFNMPEDTPRQALRDKQNTPGSWLICPLSRISLRVPLLCSSLAQANLHQVGISGLCWEGEILTLELPAAASQLRHMQMTWGHNYCRGYMAGPAASHNLQKIVISGRELDRVEILDYFWKGRRWTIL